MAVAESFLLLLIVTTVLICNMCYGGVVYVQYSRRVPSQFPGDKYVEEVVEEFEMPHMPLYYGYTDRDVQVLLQNSLGRSPLPPQRQPGFQRPTEQNFIPSHSTTIFPDYTVSTTERSFLNWFGEDQTSTTTMTPTTTRSPFFFTTKPYENSNPEYNQLIPTISVEVIPPSTTTPKQFSVTYDDINEDNENDIGTIETTTGPTKVSLPTLDETNVGVDNSEQIPAETTTLESTTEPYYEDAETYEDNYDYEGNDLKEKEDKVATEASTALAATSATEATTKTTLFSFFG